MILEKHMSGSNKKKHKDRLSEEQMIELLEEQPEEIQDEVADKIIAKRVQSLTYSGPIPHPALLKEFNEVIPNGADRIMTMAEKQSSHRLKLEEDIVKANNRDSLLGVIFGGCIALSAIIGGIWLISINKSPQGLGIIITSLVGLVSVYLTGRHQDKKDLKSKQDFTED